MGGYHIPDEFEIKYLRTDAARCAHTVAQNRAVSRTRPDITVAIDDLGSWRNARVIRRLRAWPRCRRWGWSWSWPGARRCEAPRRSISADVCHRLADNAPEVSCSGLKSNGQGKCFDVTIIN